MQLKKLDEELKRSLQHALDTDVAQDIRRLDRDIAKCAEKCRQKLS